MADNNSPTQRDNYDDCDFNLTSRSDGKWPSYIVYTVNLTHMHQN